MSVSWDILPQKYVLFKKTGYTFGAHCIVAPPSTVVTPIRLYPVFCTMYLCTLTLTRWQLQVLVTLSFAFVSDVSFQFYSEHFIGYNSASVFRSRFCLEIYKLLFSFFLLEVGCSYHSTQFWTRLSHCSYFCTLFLRSFDPGQRFSPAHFFVPGYFNPIHNFYFVGVTFSPTVQFSVFYPT